jgi:hypothetical protein
MKTKWMLRKLINKVKGLIPNKWKSEDNFE